LLIVALGALLAAAACAPRRAPLSGTAVSPEELARVVLDRLSVRDLAGLRALALDEREFREHVWPELPAARPERNLPWSFVWSDLHQKSENQLAVTLAKFGGQQLTLARIRFTGETTRYASYLVHRDSLLTVRDATGSQRDVRLFGSVLQQRDRFKVFSYVVD
jgi:hypothetical protein